MKHLQSFESFSQSVNESAQTDLTKLSDAMLLQMIDVWNEYHKNTKGSVSPRDLEFGMDLMKEKQRRKL